MKPILFNTEMVKAILDGRKTVTRRVVKFRDGKNPNWTGYVKDGLTLYNGNNEPCNMPAPYKVNDILYVREAWSERSYGYEYKADGKRIDHLGNRIKYKPSIHMPKEVARIFLKVIGVRVERLQDITEEQAKAEGVKNPHSYAENDDYWETTGRNELSADVAAFSALWDSTVHKSNMDRYGWDANPYVWVIEFEVIDKAAALFNDAEKGGAE